MKKLGLVFAVVFAAMLLSGAAIAAEAYIAPDKALDIAVQHAGVSGNTLRDVDIDFESRGGKMIYDVEFDNGEYEYHYHIDAATGEVLRHTKDLD